MENYGVMDDQIKKCRVPKSSHIARFLPLSYYSDAFTFVSRKKDRTALEIWLDQVDTIPQWVNYLMGLRNRLVSLFGLKNLGHIGDIEPTKAASEYKVGDMVGIFELSYLSDNEVILLDSDKHLDVKVSIFKDSADLGQITVSSVVHVHNMLGRLYMLFVAPIHRVIVPATIRRAEFPNMS